MILVSISLVEMNSTVFVSWWCHCASLTKTDAVLKSLFYSEGNYIVMRLSSIIHPFGFWLNDNVSLVQQTLAFDRDGLANSLRTFSCVMMDGMRFFKLTINMLTIRLRRIQ
jgi:hypothetical protein